MLSHLILGRSYLVDTATQHKPLTADRQTITSLLGKLRARMRALFA